MNMAHMQKRKKEKTNSMCLYSNEETSYVAPCCPIVISRDVSRVSAELNQLEKTHDWSQLLMKYYNDLIWT